MADGSGKPKVRERDRETEGGFKPGIQNFARYFATGVQSKSDKGTAGTSTGSRQLAPGYYSLGVESNVPFVILKGPTRQQKSLSWGETIAIPEGFAATLFNDSYHPGDIVLKGGRDWPTVPRRITVPVPFDIVDNGTSWLITPQHGVDVRRARQAFLVWGITNSVNVVVTVTGERKEGSHLTQSTQGPTYTEQETQGVGMTSLYIPLGYGAQPFPLLQTALGVLPHALLDVATMGAFGVIKADVPVPENVPMYYVVEY